MDRYKKNMYEITQIWFNKKDITYWKQVGIMQAVEITEREFYTLAPKYKPSIINEKVVMYWF